MKREKFEITSTVGHREIKHAWNASLREIERLVRELARDAGVVYTLCDSRSVKEGFYFVSGSRVWENQVNKSRVVFTVQKLAS